MLTLEVDGTRKRYNKKMTKQKAVGVPVESIIVKLDHSTNAAMTTVAGINQLDEIDMAKYFSSLLFF